MIIQQTPSLHLTYGLNVHRGETWEEAWNAIRQNVPSIRDGMAANKPFGLGLRLSNAASITLQDSAELARFRAYLDEQRLYAFTINGFPFGPFHDAHVKESVYHPDWRTAERRDYTLRLAGILAQLLPDGVSGSISTVPVSFKPWMRQEHDVQQAADHLLDVAMRLHEIGKESGKDIHLGLEPEPSCYLETTDECVQFFNDALLARGNEDIVRSRIGVCFDTCHVAVQFEDPVVALKRYQAEGIRISKVQLSAALETGTDRADLGALKPFNEPVYLHQVKALDEDGALLSWTDLPDALRELPHHVGPNRMRVHFHVPLFWEGSGPLWSTTATLTREFFDLLRAGATEHVEIETYTFDVLPEEARRMDIVESIVREYKWALDRLQVSP